MSALYNSFKWLEAVFCARSYFICMTYHNLEQSQLWQAGEFSQKYSSLAFFFHSSSESAALSIFCQMFAPSSFSGLKSWIGFKSHLCRHIYAYVHTHIHTHGQIHLPTQICALLRSKICRCTHSAWAERLGCVCNILKLHNILIYSVQTSNNNQASLLWNLYNICNNKISN